MAGPSAANSRLPRSWLEERWFRWRSAAGARGGEPRGVGAAGLRRRRPQPQRFGRRASAWPF
eukprot:10350804-Lingulodinium_polyedra.AAC.1